MSLFVVNRYLGEEEDGSVSQESRSRSLLTKLQQKAIERQKVNLAEPRGCLQTEGPTEQQHSKKKRKAGKDSSQHHKKRKSAVAAPCAAESETDEEPAEEEKGSTEEEREAATGTDVREKKKGAKQDTSSAPVVPDSAVTGFTFLQGYENRPVQKVHRVLPQWLAEPDVIHRDIKSNLVPVSEVPGLGAVIVKNLQKNGIQHFFPVQAEVIPAILDSAQQGLLIGRGGYRPRDLCVSAPTGSGKTLSFVIPVIQVLMERVVCEVRALVVLPSKELAQQVHRVFSLYAEGTGLRVLLLAGQRCFSTEQASLSELRGGVNRSLADIIVATPGRLVDHVNKSSGLSLEHLRFLIIDEADRMIDGMHQSWLSQVVQAVYRTGSGPDSVSIFKRTQPANITAASLSPPQMPLQKLLFSATLTHNPEKLHQLGLHQPRLFSSVHSNPTASHKQERFNFPHSLTEYYVPCTLSKKPLIILHFLVQMKLSPILCFTNSREAAHRLYLLVQLFGGVQAAEFSSRLSPGERRKTLKEFEQGKIQLLVSTDAAARGIDINGIKCVVNYDSPQYIRTYIHRIGRTARAGKTGLAFTFLLKVQKRNFLKMVLEAGSPGIYKHMVNWSQLSYLESRYEQTLNELADVIKAEKTKR
ncbi:ATP-dependent RNA helicase DDX51 [Pholidichthys leucotaenia]